MSKETVVDDVNHSEREYLKPQCELCFGLCCVALCFLAQDGFPSDKRPGTPCKNLDTAFRCTVHDKLRSSGMKGCAAYECFGAGQQVSQVTFQGRSWRQEPSVAEQMTQAFITMKQLHEICWYLTDALHFNLPMSLAQKAEDALNHTKLITASDLQTLIGFDLASHFFKISELLKVISRCVRGEIRQSIKIPLKALEHKTTIDYFGKDLKKKELRCADLRGACLIAANLQGMDLCGADFIGADFRDANIKGADLSESIFLTQFQINTATGDDKTKLPATLSRPTLWTVKG